MTLSRLLPLLGLAAALLVPSAANAAEAGLNINGGAASGTPQNVAQLADTGAKWGRHFLYYDDIGNGLAPYDAIVADQDRLGVKTLLTVAGASRTAPADPQAYADYVGMLAKRYRGRLEAIEIWNEQDEDHFWRGGADAPRYVDLLKRSYAAIKAADPAVKVVFGPVVGNNYGFLEQAYAAGAKGHFDVMAAHTDTACLVAPPSSFYREDGRIARYTFLGYRELRASMLAQGDDKPIWLTEIGWSAAQHTCETGMWAGKKAAGVDEATQAKNLLEAFHCLAEDPYVEVAMWFNNRDLVADQKMNNMYGLLRFDGSRRPAYDAFRDVARNGDRQTGPCGDFSGPRVQVLEPTAGAVIGDSDPLTIRATSPDADVMRMTFAVKGAPNEIRNFTNQGQPFAAGSAHALLWQGAKRLPFGEHTLVITAVDAQGNPGTTEVRFNKVNPRTLAPQRTHFPTLKLSGKGRKRVLSGQLRSTLRFNVPGKALVEWQARRGGTWKKVHGAAANANRPFRFAQTLKYGGRWRVRVVYKGQKPFRTSASRWITFKA